ncbi:MAG: hypothetical protein AAF939_18765 [Planctomycetota bacterium]
MSLKAQNKSGRKREAVKNVALGWSESKFRYNRDSLHQILKLLVCKDVDRRKSSLGWFLPKSQNESKKLLDRWTSRSFQRNKSPEKLSSEILDRIEKTDSCRTLDDAILILGSSHFLRYSAGNCEFHNWNSFLEKLLEVSSLVVSQKKVDSIIYQWIAIELPITIAFQVSQLPQKTTLAELAKKRLEINICEMLDHDGWPLGRYLENLGLITASWARSCLILKKLGQKLTPDTTTQLGGLARQIIRLLRPDKTLIFTHANSGKCCDAFLASLSKLTDNRFDKSMVKFWLFPKRQKKITSAYSTSNISEWAECALLQSSWHRKSPKLAINFSINKPRVELLNNRQLLDGEFFPEIKVEGKIQKPLSHFEVICELSDGDVEYLELEMNIGDELSLNRQFLLSKNENFLLFADLIRSNRKSHLDYQLRMPLDHSINGMAETENREVYLIDPKIRALVLPVFLPEWKSEPSSGSLQVNETHIQINQSLKNKAMYLPVFFDLDAKRSKQKRTWRKITVAENRQPVPSEQACAFRIQLDEQQWFFYRSIGETGNRSFLGENFIGEFAFYRFDRTGLVTSLIEIHE